MVDIGLDALHDVTRALWIMTITATLHSLWSWRVRLLYGEHTTVAAQRATLLARVGRKAKLLGYVLRPQKDLTRCKAELGLMHAFRQYYALTERLEVCAALRTAAAFVLFLYGCSQGNPGSGGSRAIILRVDIETRSAGLVWLPYLS